MRGTENTFGRLPISMNNSIALKTENYTWSEKAANKSPFFNIYYSSANIYIYICLDNTICLICLGLARYVVVWVDYNSR